MPNKLYIIDTCSLMNNANNLNIFSDYNLVITGTVLAELEKHKVSNDRDLAYRTRRATRFIKDNEDNFTFDLNTYDVSLLGSGFSEDLWDDHLLASCVCNGYGLITDDYLLQLKAEGLNIEVVDFEDKCSMDIECDPDYKGYKVVEMTPSELQEVYNNPHVNSWGLLENEYLIVEDCFLDTEIDAFCWRDSAMHKVNETGFRTQQFGTFKPKDYYQSAALDSVINNDVTMLTGKAGTGKSLIALESAWNLIERGLYDRVIIFNNPSQVRGSESLGYYTGNRTEKLLQNSIGNMLISKFGDLFEVEREIDLGRLTVLPFSDIRGFDTSSEGKTIVIFVEAQNTNVDLMRLGLERIGEGDKVIIDGDPTTQVDNDSFRISNGMTRVSEVFRGQDLYGEVQLKYIYRSRIADLANLM